MSPRPSVDEDMIDINLTKGVWHTCQGGDPGAHPELGTRRFDRAYQLDGRPEVGMPNMLHYYVAAKHASGRA